MSLQTAKLCKTQPIIENFEKRHIFVVLGREIECNAFQANHILNKHMVNEALTLIHQMEDN